ncbi:MAG: DUF6882 domain-containing protein [Tepidisphaeraceae bacterium]|jgi:hypothetical protein
MQTVDPPELREQIEKALNGLAAVTAAHNASWHLERGSWNVDQNIGTIVFSMPDGIKAEAPVQIIGTYSTTDSTWLWGWDHPSVVPRLMENAKRMRDYGREHGFDRLTTRKLHCTVEECWELTALAFLLCNANGAYRGPAGTARVFMTFGEIKLSKT